MKLLKKIKEHSRKSKTTHKRVKLQNYPLQRQSHPFEHMKRSALSYITSFGAVKKIQIHYSANHCSYF